MSNQSKRGKRNRKGKQAEDPIAEENTQTEKQVDNQFLEEQTQSNVEQTTQESGTNLGVQDQAETLKAEEHAGINNDQIHDQVPHTTSQQNSITHETQQPKQDDHQENTEHQSRNDQPLTSLGHATLQHDDHTHGDHPSEQHTTPDQHQQNQVPIENHQSLITEETPDQNIETQDSSNNQQSNGHGHIGDPEKLVQNQATLEQIADLKHEPVHQLVTEISQNPTHEQSADKTHEQFHEAIEKKHEQVVELKHEPIQETAAEIKHQPIQEPAAEIKHQPIQEPAAEIKHQPIQEPAAEIKHQPIQEPAAEIKHQPIQETAAEIKHEPIQEPAAEIKHQPIQETAAEIKHQPIQETAAEIKHQPIQETAAEIKHQPIQEPAAEIKHQPIQEPAAEIKHELIHAQVIHAQEEPIHENHTEAQSVHQLAHVSNQSPDVSNQPISEPAPQTNHEQVHEQDHQDLHKPQQQSEHNPTQEQAQEIRQVLHQQPGDHHQEDLKTQDNSNQQLLEPANQTEPSQQSQDQQSHLLQESAFEVISGHNSLNQTEFIEKFTNSAGQVEHLRGQQEVLSEQNSEKFSYINQRQEFVNSEDGSNTIHIEQSSAQKQEQEFSPDEFVTPTLRTEKLSTEPDIKKINIARFTATFEEANMLKNQGNEHVKNQNYNEAINSYADALRICHPIYLMECPGELIEQFKQLNINVLNNLSFSYLNVGEFNECISFGNQVLQVDERNSKALFRIALAYEQKDDIEEAYKFITKAKQSARGDERIAEKHAQLKDKYLSQKDVIKQQQKEVFSKMFRQESQKSAQKQEQPVEVSTSQINNSAVTVEPAPEVPKKTPTEYAAYASQAVVSTAVATLLSTSITKYLLKEKFSTPNSLFSAGIVGGGVFGIVLAKKLWQKLAFGAASSGAIAILLLTKLRST